MTAGFLDVSRRLLDALGPEGVGSEWEQQDYAVDGREPRWVCLPANRDQCAAALRTLAGASLAVVPVGLGARLGQGAPPARLDAVVALPRMDRIVDHAAADLTLTVEAGATLAAVNEALRPSGQWLPYDPPLAARTTIGGLVAANASGPARQRLGTVRERLIGVRALLADGTGVKSGGRVVKNVAGYDLQKLLVGSFGTLAVLVEASFKLAPLAEETACLTFSAPAIAPLAALALGLAASPLEPQFLELVVATGGAPRLVVGLCGLAEEVRAAAPSIRERSAAIDGVAETTPMAPADVTRAIDEVAVPGGSATVVRLGVRPSELAAALERAVCAAPTVRAHAHAGVGVARLRFDDLAPEPAAALVAELRAAATASGGYLVVECAPAAVKSALDVWGPPPAGFALMKRVKRAFDAAGALAPGRFVGGI